MATSMELAKRKEVLFISYDEIIKTPYPFLLDIIRKNYKDIYKDFIDIERIENLSMEELEVLCSSRTETNIIKYLAISEFDYNKTLWDLYNKYKDIYFHVKPLEIAQILPFLLAQPFIEKVYIYNPFYDTRQHLDCELQFEDMFKVNYVTGDIVECVNSIYRPTMYILNNADQAKRIIDNCDVAYTEILIAKMGYNYKMENGEIVTKLDSDKLLNEKIVKISEFSNIKFNKDSFKNNLFK